jgi:arabinogalactan endo-1,4-beta-galactosidase
MMSPFRAAERVPRQFARGLRAILAALALASPSACGGAAAATETAKGVPVDTTTAPTPTPAGFIIGADLSTLPSVESAGGAFSQDGTRDDAIAILKRNGFNYVRLRLFHAPDHKRELVNDVAYDVALASRAKTAGLKFLLDIHYSDTWADPGTQTKPAAWANLTFDQLRDSVFAYTRDVVTAFRVAGAAPDMIQIGNEVNVGMLWPDGHADQVDADWAHFADLVKAGRDGARAGMNGTPVLFMHHVADPKNVIWHMDNLLRHIEAPDVIGVSYYPVWHGDLTTFATNMAAIAVKYGKPVVIAETAYPWTNASFDGYADVYHGAPASGMPAYSAAGQQDFFARFIAALKATPGGRGMGFFYWEPAWLPSGSFGSPVENMTLFDQSGAALPALKTIHDATK